MVQRIADFCSMKFGRSNFKRFLISPRPENQMRVRGPMNRNRLVAVLVTCAFGIILSFAISVSRSVAGQSSAQDSQSASVVAASDDLQISHKIDDYTELADSGPARGENIYWHKCWVCHNQYQKEAPHLEGLFKLSNLIDNSPVNDGTVANQIRTGGPGMPSFRTTLSDSDVADLVGYLRSDNCCVEGEHLPTNPSYRAAAEKWAVPKSLSGGPRGVVRIASGDPPGGVMVQLVAPNGVRTTVYTDDDGNYGFPKMQSGSYILRIANPLEFKRYRRDSVRIDGDQKLDDIVLERITTSLSLPATPEIESQVSGEELFWNLPGSVEEKEAFHAECGGGCHSFQQIFKNRYDERSWGVLVARMTRRGGGPLINPPAKEATSNELAEQQVVTKWLAKVRGPGSKDGAIRIFPRLTGPSNRVVLTEYELPRRLLSAHDVYGDSNGNIWYTSHFSRYIGRLDSHTGIVTEYQIPLTPGALPGTHHALVEKSGMVLITVPWAHQLLKYDPKTDKFTEMGVEASTRINSAGLADFDVTPDGFIWNSFGGSYAIQKIDPETGKTVEQWPIKVPFSYDSVISWDGNFFAGASPVGTTWNAAELLNIRTGEVLNVNTGDSPSSGRRGGFDPFGNAWFAGQNGTLVELDAKAKRLREFWPPAPNQPYTDFYSAMPDKTGDVWTAELHGRVFLRFNPRTGYWTKYALPEPYAHARWTWVDNSTDPVSVWFADFSTGRIVRIQPFN
jgi:streptogramin lyase/mono/diheme cytochrome c family protein